MRGAVALVGVVTLVVFAPALRGDFVLWDDDLNFLNNSAYRGLTWTHLGWMFTTYHGGHWQPLSWMTLALDWTLWGLRPAGYHLTSVVLHAATAAVVFLVLRALLATRLGPPAGLVVPAAIGALFFSIHPLRVESVAWVSERRDVLSGLFYCLTVLFYLGAQEAAGAARTRRMGASLACFALSLLAKAWGITLPLVLLILDAYPLGRLGQPAARRTALVEKAPYALLAVLAGVLAFRAQQVEAMRTLAQHGLTARLAQAAYGLCFYLGKSLVPVGLSPHYLLEVPLDPWRARYVVSGAAVVVLGGALVAARRRAPWALAAFAAYAVILAPVLGLVQSGNQITADRYSYLACLPFAALLAAGLVRRSGAWGRAGAAFGLAVLALLTVAQIRVWRDSRSLWDHVIALDPRNYTAWSNRGLVRQAAGDTDGARADYDTALRLNPGHELTWNNRGIVRFQQGDVDGAIADYTAAIRFRPAYPDAHVNRAIAREAAGDMDGALADYGEALRLNPSHATAAYGRGRLRALRGDLPGALTDLDEAVRLAPGKPEVWAQRALVREQARDVPGARDDLRQALAVAPPDWPWRADLERLLASAEGRR